MKKYLFKRIARIFFFSFIWLFLPLSTILIPVAHESYVEAGTHLTPYSVSVRGYYRKDGTYVRPHSRRPPGSVAHDAPYQAKRSGLFWGMVGLVVLGGGSTIGFVFFTREEIINRKSNYKEYIKEG